MQLGDEKPWRLRSSWREMMTQGLSALSAIALFALGSLSASVAAEEAIPDLGGTWVGENRTVSV